MPKNLLGKKVTFKVDFSLPPLEINSQTAEFTLPASRGDKPKWRAGTASDPGAARH